MATLGDFFDAVRIRGLDESVIDDPSIPTSFNATPKDGTLELPRGSKGPDGDPGTPAVAYSWRGEVIDETALEALQERLEPKHVGRAYRVLSTQRLVYWDGQAFVSFTDAFGGKGPDGPLNNLTIGTVTTGAVGSELIVSITGSSPNQVLNLTVPRGGKGQKGPDGRPGPIRSAPDFDNSVAPIDGMVPVWDDVNDKWKLARRPGPIGPYSIPDTGFTSFGSTTATVTVATLSIPAQVRPYIPWPRGHMLLRPTGTNSAFRTVVEVFLGDPAAGGQLVGIGYALPMSVIDSPITITPHYGSTGTGAVAPNANTRIVPAGTAVTLYVRVRKITGNGSYSFDRSRAQLVVYGFEPNVPLPVL